MPRQAWRTPRAASLLQLAVLVPRLVRTYAAPTAAAATVLITSNGFGDEGTAIAGHSDPETPPGSSGRCSQAGSRKERPSELTMRSGISAPRIALPPTSWTMALLPRNSVLVETGLVGNVGAARRCLCRSDPRVDGPRLGQSPRSVISRSPGSISTDRELTFPPYSHSVVDLGR
jgi:hypothetical protein